LQDASDATLETLKAIQHPISRQAQILVEVCSFVATGNVLRVQRLLHLCGEHLDALKEKEQAESAEGKKDENKDEKKEDKKPDDTFQSFAVLGIAMIAMGEDIGAEMSMRQFNHLVYLFGRDNIQSSY
jgi:26S proteasome regulatory subunit N1